MITRAAITQLGIWVPWKNVEFEKPKVRRESAKQIFRRAKMKLGLTITIVLGILPRPRQLSHAEVSLHSHNALPTKITPLVLKLSYRNIQVEPMWEIMAQL